MHYHDNMYVKVAYDNFGNKQRYDDDDISARVSWVPTLLCWPTVGRQNDHRHGRPTMTGRLAHSLI